MAERRIPYEFELPDYWDGHSFKDQCPNVIPVDRGIVVPQSVLELATSSIKDFRKGIGFAFVESFNSDGTCNAAEYPEGTLLRFGEEHYTFYDKQQDLLFSEDLKVGVVVHIPNSNGTEIRLATCPLIPLPHQEGRELTLFQRPTITIGEVDHFKGFGIDSMSRVNWAEVYQRT